MAFFGPKWPKFWENANFSGEIFIPSDPQQNSAYIGYNGISYQIWCPTDYTLKTVQMLQKTQNQNTQNKNLCNYSKLKGRNTLSDAVLHL